MPKLRGVRERRVQPVTDTLIASRGEDPSWLIIEEMQTDPVVSMEMVRVKPLPVAVVRTKWRRWKLFKSWISGQHFPAFSRFFIKGNPQ